MKRNQIKTVPIEPFRIYRVDEAAQALQVDRTTIYKAISAEKLPKKKIGRGYKFLGEDLLRFAGSATFSGPQEQSPFGAVTQK